MYQRKVPVRELATLVRRGGTSGAGVAVFEGGGVVLDAGHTFGEGKEKQAFLPSSYTQAPPAPLLARYSFPNDWRLVCVRVEGVRGKSGEEEAAFFARYCPIDAADVAETCWILLMQLLPALVSKDLQAFSGAIDSLQTIAFKKEIWKSQPAEVQISKHIMQDLGIAGIGLSSLGPTLYCVTAAKKARTIAIEVENALRKRTIRAAVWATRARNSGAYIHHSYDAASNLDEVVP